MKIKLPDDFWMMALFTPLVVFFMLVYLLIIVLSWLMFFANIVYASLVWPLVLITSKFAPEFCLNEYLVFVSETYRKHKRRLANLDDIFFE